MTHSPKQAASLLAQSILTDSLANVTWHIKSPVLFTTDKNADESTVVGDNVSELQPFNNRLINEVAQFSQFLFSDNTSKTQPQLVALAFWCRKSNLQAINADFKTLDNAGNRKPIGKVFHIAPANVDTVFFYSLLLSVLSGNSNIVRISERSGALCRQLLTLFQQFLVAKQPKLLPALVSIVEYSATENKITSACSQWCDLRIIWGGDSAIAAISAIAPSTKQLCFPDRFSIALCQLNEDDDIEKVAQAFVADFLPFNQQACSSPKALYWLNTAKALQQHFYCELNQHLAAHQQQFSLSEQVEKQINLQQLLLICDNPISDKIFNSQFMQVQLKDLYAAHLIAHQGNGLLLTEDINHINQLPFDKKLQTVNQYGLKQQQVDAISERACKRITSFGQALTFSHIWDGVNLLKILSTKA